MYMLMRYNEASEPKGTNVTTATGMPPKDVVAERLAKAHFDIESGISRIFRIVGPHETDSSEPIKLLEVNENTIASGIVPVHFGAHRSSGIVYPAIIVEITPDEFESMKRTELKLPDSWSLGQEYTR